MPDEGGPERLWVLHRLPPNPVEAACLALSALAADSPLPEGCRLELSARTDGRGGLGLRIEVDDPEGLLSAGGMAPSASIFIRKEGFSVNDAILAFAEMLEEKAGPPARGVRRRPQRMREFCAQAIRRTAEAVQNRAPRQEAEEEDGALKP